MGRHSLWDTTGAKQVASQLYGAQSLSFSPDGRLLALRDWAGRLQIVDTVSWKVRVQSPPQLVAFELRYSPVGGKIATGYDDGSVVLWDVPDE